MNVTAVVNYLYMVPTSGMEMERKFLEKRLPPGQASTGMDPVIPVLLRDKGSLFLLQCVSF